MRLTLTEPRYLKDSIGIIADLVNEATFSINQEGMELIAMDPANVAMVIFKLLSSSFTEFDVPEKVDLAINLNNLKQILRRSKANDVLSLEIEENKLKIQFRGDTTRTFYLPIIELDEKEQKVPQLTFPLSIETSPAILSDAIEDVDVVAESVTFLGDDLKLLIKAEGDLSKAKIEIPKGDETAITAENQDKVKAKYSIEYLKKMITGGKLSDKVTIYFNNDYPLKLEYKTVDRVLLSFILAPRVEND